MAKIKDMSTKSYNRQRAIEKGEQIRWASIYAQSLRTRATTIVAKGGATILHAHQRAIAQATLYR